MNNPSFLGKIIQRKEHEITRLNGFKQDHRKDPLLLCDSVASELGLERDIIVDWLGPWIIEPEAPYVIFCSLTMMRRNTAPLIKVASVYTEYIFEFLCVFNNIWGLRSFEHIPDTCPEGRILSEITDLTLGKNPDASIKWTLSMVMFHIRNLFGLSPRDSPLSSAPEIDIVALFPNFIVK